MNTYRAKCRAKWPVCVAGIIALGLAAPLGSGAQGVSQERREQEQMQRETRGDRVLTSQRFDDPGPTSLEQRLVEELEALPLGRDKQFYRRALQRRDYQIVDATQADQNETQVKVAKKDRTLMLAVWFDGETGDSIELVAWPLWSEEEVYEGKQERRAQDPGQRQARRENERARGRQPQQARTQQIQGEVIAMKKVDVRGTDQTATVVRLKTDDNRRVIADLGLTQDPNLQEAQVRVGDEISMRGRVVRVGDTAVLAAEQIEVEGESYRLDRERQAQQQRSAFQQAQTKQAEPREQMSVRHRQREQQAAEAEGQGSRQRRARATGDDDAERESAEWAPPSAEPLEPEEFRTQAERDLEERIRVRLQEDPELASVAQRIQITTELGGTVILQGRVASEQLREQIGEEVQQVRGVEKVKNQLRVGSRSRG